MDTDNMEDKKDLYITEICKDLSKHGQVSDEMYRLLTGSNENRDFLKNTILETDYLYVYENNQCIKIKKSPLKIKDIFHDKSQSKYMLKVANYIYTHFGYIIDGYQSDDCPVWPFHFVRLEGSSSFLRGRNIGRITVQDTFLSIIEQDNNFFFMEKTNRFAISVAQKAERMLSGEYIKIIIAQEEQKIAKSIKKSENQIEFYINRKKRAEKELKLLYKKFGLEAKPSIDTSDPIKNMGKEKDLGLDL